MEDSKNQISSISQTPSPVLGGKERREAVNLWKSIADSKSRINLMRVLIKEGMGLAELEQFQLDLSSKFRSSKFTSSKPSVVQQESKLVEQTMKLKLADELAYYKELCAARTKLRRQIAKTLKNNSRPFRRAMKELQQEEKKRKEDLSKKFKEKVSHLKNKYKSRHSKSEENEDIPEDMKNYVHLTVFNKKKYEDTVPDNYDVKVIGEVKLTVEEMEVLKLHPKFCVTGVLDEVEFEHEQEAALAKVRMQVTKEKEQEDLTSEEIQLEEDLEAKTRQVYNPIEDTYDSRKRKVTDLKECSRITLPRPISPDEEAALEIRKNSQMKIFKEYCKENTNKKGEIKSNLTRQEPMGLKSLQKRIAAGEIVIMKTDKSAKFAVTTPEKYLEMGLEHVGKDEKITRAKIIEMEETLNGHNKAWANIWGTGQDHKHFERVVASKTTHSENVADLYLMFKDHKPGLKTRPTATGCSSNTLGLSNAVAEVLEAVANSEKRRYNTISSEDLLSRIHLSNKKILEKQLTWEKTRVKKLRCIKCKIMEKIDCVNTELHNWEDILENTEEQGDAKEVSKDLEEIKQASIIASKEIQNWICCGQEIQDQLERSCEACGPGITNWDAEFSIVGSDVKALYPSIQSESSGKIIRKRIEKTKLEFEGFSVEKALAYIAMNPELTTDLDEIAHILPSRKSGKTTKLKISAIKQDWDPKDKFEFKQVDLSQQDKKNIVARVVEIATRALFQNHGYKFGNEYYKQTEGGSIGDRWTGCASELVMQTWAEEYQEILTRSKLEVLLLSGYVDDGRQITSSFPLGARYNKVSRSFEITEAALEEDKNLKHGGESNNQRMARICLDAMNDINKDLEFTVEAPEDFPNEQLPTLDFKLWQEADKTINHSYFQKPMKSPLTIMARSGMGKQQKMQILSNELTRRLSNTNINNTTKQEITRIIEEFTKELKNSEYHQETAKQIVMSGIRGHRTRITRRTANGQEFYRPAHKTVNTRNKKKIMARQNWFRIDKEEQEHNEQNTKNTKNKNNNKTKHKKQENLNQNNTKNQIKAVMFIPYTPDGELAKLLRKNEEDLSKITDCKIKIIERAGTKLQDLITRSDPWKGSDCHRPNCLPCLTKIKTEKYKNQDCHKRSIVYETRCLTCQEQEHNRIDNLEIEESEKREQKLRTKLYKYIGETSRSGFERGWEHLNDLAQLKPTSHMLKHILLTHPEQDMSEVQFGMRTTRTCMSSFERQIYESVSIQKERQEHFVLNSRTEYNRCSLPRIRTQVGEQDIKEYNEEIRKEKLEEEKIEKLIINLRKQRNKARLMPGKALNQGTKRRKINSEDYITIKEIWGKPEKTESKKNKAESQLEQEPRIKKLRTEQEEEKHWNTAPVLEQEQESTPSKQEDEEQIPEPPIMGQELDEQETRWEKPRDWEQVLRNHRERIQKEEQEITARMELKKKKENSWELYRLSKKFLTENNEKWNRRKEKEQEEISRLERLEQARNQGIKTRLKLLGKEQEKRISEIPSQIMEQVELEQKKQETLELKRAKESLWRLRKTEKNWNKLKKI